MAIKDILHILAVLNKFFSSIGKLCSENFKPQKVTVLKNFHAPTGNNNTDNAACIAHIGAQLYWSTILTYF